MSVLDHHAGSAPGRPAAILRDSIAPHPVAEREAAFARADRGSPITARRSALHDGVQQPLTSNGSVKLAVDRLPRARPRRAKPIADPLDNDARLRAALINSSPRRVEAALNNYTNSTRLACGAERGGTSRLSGNQIAESFGEKRRTPTRGINARTTPRINRAVDYVTSA